MFSKREKLNKSLGNHEYVESKENSLKPKSNGVVETIKSGTKESKLLKKVAF